DFFTSTIRFSINGSKESLNDIQLDGVTAMVQSDIQGIYGASAIPSVEGIQEFRVQTNSYTAEYGRSGGGQVTMVTKSGSNDFHGSAFEFLRNSAMDAKSFFLNRSNGRKASFQQHQYGASTGGPIKKDKTFFFALYAAKRWPAPNQVGQLNTNQNNLAIQKVPRSPTDRVDFKVDHSLSQNRRMFVRYNRFKQATAAADFWDNGAAPSDGIMYWGS